MATLRLPKSGRELSLPEDSTAAAEFLADTFKRSGYTPEGVYVDWEDFAGLLDPKAVRDLTTTTEVQALLEHTIQIVIKEPVEFPATITSLFTKVNAKGMTTTTIAGATGAIYAADVQEHGTYPEVSFQVGPGVSVSQIGKTGIQASFTDEALRYTTWDLMAINLRNMKNAMVRWREQKASAFLSRLGTTLYNNSVPSNSLYGVTQGRDIALAANGALTMDDLMIGYAHMGMEGFQPAIVLCHPLTYYMWWRDPVMRNMLIAHGGGSYYNPWTGSLAQLPPWNNGGMGVAGPSNGYQIVPGGTPSGETVTGTVGYSQNMSSAPTIPGYAGLNLTFVTSMLVPYDPATKLTDVYLIAPGNVGYWLVDEDQVQITWRDENTETTKMKLRERYSFHVINEGQGLGVFRDVAIVQNFFDGTVRAVDSSGVTAIPAETPVV